MNLTRHCDHCRFPVLKQTKVKVLDEERTNDYAH